MINININEKATLIWSIADKLRGDFKQSEYGKVILPLTVGWRGYLFSMDVRLW